MPSDGRPILDAAITAATDAGNTVGQWHDCFAVATIAALRVANPWELPAQEIEVMARGFLENSLRDQISEGRETFVDAYWENFIDGVTVIYRSRPIMRELYPERFTVSGDDGERERGVRFGSLFSGIEAASAAWLPLGWSCAWVAEIDPFACAVLRHHYPDVPNLGDVNRIDPDAVEPVDLVVFGSPCQSFSVAGKRLGLDDPRGNMALVGLRVIGRIRPRWVVGRTSPEYCRATREGILEPSSGYWANSGMGSPTGFLTLSTPEFHSAAVASSLSDVLETGEVPRRYFLSPKACAGILRRAAKTGKELPPQLHQALTQAALPAERPRTAT